MVVPGVRSLGIEGTMEEPLSDPPTTKFAQREWDHRKAVTYRALAIY